MRRGRMLAATMAAAVLLAVRASGSGGPPPKPDYVTANALQPIDRAALAAARVGILKGSAPAPILYLNWRLLNGLESGLDSTNALATPCCGEKTDRSYAWLEARRAVPGAAPDVYYIATERPGPDYTSVPTCFGDAFETAVLTLNDRIARYGTRSPWVRAWLAGQDAVFASCSQSGVALPALDASAPAWLRADRAYQTAALALYDGRLADAEQDFAAIEHDTWSPWQPLALYLQVRTVQRAAIIQPDAPGFARAHAALARLQQAPAGTYGKGEIDRIVQVLEYHEHPASLLARLDRDLNASAPTPDIAVKFKDYWSLSTPLPTKPEAADWIATFQAKDRVAGLAHARDRWRATHRSPWLVAALSLATPEDVDSAALASDAAQTEMHDPAWLTMQYHWMRLDIARWPAKDMRSRVDAILARRDLTPSDRNIFLAVRTQLAPTLTDFAVHALRQPYCTGTGTSCVDGNFPSGDGLLGRRGRDFVGFGGDARAVIDRLPLPARLALGRDPAVPRALRLDIALTNYTRAVLLQDNAAIDETARALTLLLPQVRADWVSIARTTPSSAKRFAEFFVMAKIPSLRADLANYSRPEGAEAAFSGYWADWWLIPPAGRRAADVAFPPADSYMPETYWDGGNASEGIDSSDLPCGSKCGQGRFQFHIPPFALPLVPAALRERGRFPTGASGGRDTTGATSLWDEALAYIRTHPRDSRAEETLYRLIRVARWGGNHGHLGKRAFTLLHARYPRSTWAKRSPYFYDR